MALNEHEYKRRIISRHFRRYFFQRGPFTGPPENTRDYVIAGARELMKGNWRKAVELIFSRTCWRLVENSEDVIAMLRRYAFGHVLDVYLLRALVFLSSRKIQIEGLRTFLFSNAAFYDAISLEQLVEMFELPKNTIHSVISKVVATFLMACEENSFVLAR